MTSETTLLVEYFAVILLRTLKRKRFQPNNNNKNKNLVMDVLLGGWLFLFAAYRSNWNSENWFLWRKKNGRTSLGARTRINDKLKLHVSPSLGIQLGLQ